MHVPVFRGICFLWLADGHRKKGRKKMTELKLYKARIAGTKFSGLLYEMVEAIEHDEQLHLKEYDAEVFAFLEKLSDIVTDANGELEFCGELIPGEAFRVTMPGADKE